MSDTQKLDMIREVMPVSQNTAYLNTGSVGPISTITSQTIRHHDEIAVREGRATMAAFMACFESKAQLRQRFAALTGASVEEIALTHHTTDGMNIIAHGLSWRPGDEIITTDWEHPGGLLPLYVLRQKYGVTVKVVGLTVDDDIAAKFEAVITARTRLIALSHVAWNTGLRLPMEEIVTMAHRHKVLVLADGAQSAGAIPLDLPASGVDFYAMPGQKWLCGPEGTGALYLRREHLNIISPTYVGYPSMDGVGRHDWTGHYLPQPDARRYEVGTVYRPGINGMVANMDWLDRKVGWDWIYARILYLAAYAREALAAMPGVEVITPPGPQAGLVTFTLDRYDPVRVVVKLGQENIIIRSIDHPYALRIATGFYNSEEDIDRLVAALQAIQKLDPELLPKPAW